MIKLFNNKDFSLYGRKDVLVTLKKLLVSTLALALVAQAFLPTAVMAYEAEVTEVEGFADYEWTEEQVEYWGERFEAHQDLFALLDSYLSFAEGDDRFDISSFETMRMIALMEYDDLGDAVRRREVSFEDAILSLERNADTLNYIFSSLRDMGVEVLEPFARWTEQEIEDWFELLFSYNLVWWQIFDLEDEIIGNDGSAYFDHDSVDWDWYLTTFGTFLQEFQDISELFFSLQVDAERSRVTFEEAAPIARRAITDLEDLYIRFREAAFPGTTVDPKSVIAISTFLTQNTADNPLVIPAGLTTDIEIVAAVTQILNTMTADDVVARFIMLDDGVVYGGRIQNVNLILTQNPTEVFENVVIYFEHATPETTTPETITPEEEATLPQTSSVTTNVAFLGLALSAAGTVAATVKKKFK